MWALGGLLIIVPLSYPLLIIWIFSRSDNSRLLPTTDSLIVVQAWLFVMFLPMLLVVLPRTLEFRRQGLLIFHGFGTALIPWCRVECAKWSSVSGKLQIQLRRAWPGIDVLVDKKEAAITALRSIVELRDVAGRVMNPEIHATGRAGDRDAAMPARRFQFDLRTLLLFMLFASAALSWYGIYYRRDSAEKAALARLDPFKPQIISGPGLLWVDFSASAIKPGDHDLALLSELVTLDNLNLSGAPITDAGLEYLAHLNSLRQLDLSNTAVGDEGLRHLEMLPRLRYLTLTGTRVTGEGVKRLQQAAPRVEVVQ